MATSPAAFADAAFDLATYMNDALRLPAQNSSEGHDDDIDVAISAASVRLQLMSNELSDTLQQHMMTLSNNLPRTKRDSKIIIAEAGSLKSQLMEIQHLHSSATSGGPFLQQLSQLDLVNERLHAVKQQLAHVCAWHKLARRELDLDAEAPIAGEEQQSLASSISRLSEHCSALEACARSLAGYPGEEGRAEVVAQAQRAVQAAVEPLLLKALRRNDASAVREVLTALESAVGAPSRISGALARARVLPLQAAWAAYRYAGKQGTQGAVEGLSEEELLSIASAAHPAATREFHRLQQLAAQGGSAGGGEAGRFATWLGSYYAALCTVLSADEPLLRSWYEGKPEACVRCALLAMCISSLGSIHDGSLASPSHQSPNGSTTAQGEGSSHGLEQPSLQEWRLRLDEDSFVTESMVDTLASGHAQTNWEQLASLVQLAEGTASHILGMLGSAEEALPALQSLAAPYSWYALQQETLDGEQLSRALERVQRGSGSVVVTAPLPIPPASSPVASTTARMLLRQGGLASVAPPTGMSSIPAVQASLAVCGSTLSSALSLSLPTLHRCHALSRSVTQAGILAVWTDALLDCCGKAYTSVVSLHSILTAEHSAAAAGGGGPGVGGLSHAPTQARGMASAQGGPGTTSRQGGESWMDAAGPKAPSGQLTTQPYTPAFSAAEVNTVCLQVWATCADAILALHTLQRVAAVYLGEDAHVLQKLLLSASTGGKPSTVSETVLFSMLGLEYDGGGHNSHGGAGAAARLEGVKHMLQGLQAQRLESQQEDTGVVERPLPPAIVSCTSGGSEGVTALCRHTYALCYDAVLAGLTRHVKGLHASPLWAVQQGTAHVHEDEDDAQDALDSYSVQPSTAITSLCEALLAVAMASAPASHPLVKGASAAPGASASVTALRGPAHPPLALVVSAHAQACLSGVLQGRLGEEEIAEAQRMLRAGTGQEVAGSTSRVDGSASAEAFDAREDATVALLSHTAGLLGDTRGLGLPAWAHSLAAAYRTDTDALQGRAYVSPSTSAAEVTDVAAAMARLWLHALARGCCAGLAMEVLSVPPAPGPAGVARDKRVRSHIRADAEYLSTVVRVLGAEPHPVLLQAVATRTGGEAL